MNCYATLSELKSRLSITVTTYDAALLSWLEAASRTIDRQCGRHFYVWSGARVFDVTGERLLFRAPHPDLLAASAVGVDNDGDGLFDDETWAATDYLLYSGEGATDGFPKLWLTMAPYADYSMPRGIRTLQITGNWGYGDGQRADPVDAGGTLGAAIASASATSVTMTAGHGVLAGHTIRIDSEQMFVSGVSTNTLTVERGVNGTTAAAHDNGAAVNIFAVPKPIELWTLCQAESGYLETGQNMAFESERIGDYSYRRATGDAATAMEGRILAPYALP